MTSPSRSTSKTPVSFVPIIGILLIGICLPLFSQTQLRVGVYDFYPLCSPEFHERPDGTETGGLFIDILEYIAQRENWRIEYVPGTLPECLRRIADGTIDLVVAASYDSELEETLDFTEETVISTWAKVYGTEKSDVRSLLDLANRTVGVVRDDPYNSELRKTIEALNLRVEFVEFVDYRDVLDGLNQGWIDAGVVDRLYGILNASTYSLQNSPILFSPVELRFATRNNTHGDIITALDYHVRLLKKDPSSLYHESINQVLGTSRQSGIPRRFFWALGITVLLLLFSGGISILLRKQVKTQTSELSRKNLELQDEIAMRTKAETALRESNQLLRRVLSSMGDGLALVSQQTLEILHCNRALAEMLQCDQNDLMRKHLTEFFAFREGAEEFLMTARTHVARRGFYTQNLQLIRADSSALPTEILLTPMRTEMTESGEQWVMIFRDNTWREELRRSERMLRQAQKMEAIGTLAGGIAHDFNNILMPIIGYTELLRRSLGEDEKERMLYISQVTQAASRARDLVKQILAFSRQKEHEERRPLYVGLIVKEALKLLRASVPSTIEINWDIRTEEDLVTADPTQVHQLLMNLCTNAAHEMRDGGGTLTVTLQEHSGPVIGWSPDGITAGRKWVRLSVQDTGKGIAPSVLHRIFDPFFTTKRTGEGTGMGLAVVHGIVKSYEGLISVETSPTSGTTFHVYLPKAAASNTTEIASNENPGRCYGKQERVLFVDDEPMITELAEETLKDQGYRVIAKTSSAEAWDLFANTPDRFEIVITDQTMPDLTGGELARKILSIRPSIPIIVCTGYSETLPPETAKSLGIREYLHKPVAPIELARIIRETLDACMASA